VPTHYNYRYVDAPRLTRSQASLILEAASRNVERVKVSLDLCLSRSMVEVRGGRVILGEVEVGLNSLKELRDNVVYEAIGSVLRPIEARSSGGYYKLRPIGPCGPPTLEINGIHMHRIQDMNPFRDAELKFRALKPRRGSRVLDVCTGLGYTAIQALLHGASSVTSIEADPKVLEIAEHNPWSRMLGDERVTILLGKAEEAVGMLEGPFDYIVHDPPRFTGTTGSLYSSSLYSEFHRLLRCGGKLFHYTGMPGRVRGRSLAGSIASRLKRLGFRVWRADDALGVVGVKEC